MIIVGKNLDKIGFKQYVADYNFGTIPPNRLVLHHTWKPIEEDGDGIIEPGEWNGSYTVQALKTYYERKGWQTAPHLFVAEDGIWLFTPFYDVGVHAGKGNATYKSKFSNARFNGYIGRKGAGNWKWNLESYSIGIEVVGDYDDHKPSGKTLDNTLFVIKTLMDRLKIQKDIPKVELEMNTC